MSGDDIQTEALAQSASGRVIVERYALAREIGRGGMGVVWRAEDRVIGRAVAVKEMHLADGVSDAERAEFEARIMREARTAGKLNDPAVVTVFDVVHDAGSVFIVMELVEAPTLAELIRAAGPLAPAAVADIGKQVLSALESAHAAGIVHRDVKPSNIMVAPSGRVKLTDFGIAQAADDPTLTKTGTVVGSPAYLAPERLSGHEASPASDIWSLGAVLFYAVEGHGAYERDTTAATLSAVLNEVPYMTRAQGPLAAAISGMLAAAPEGRLAGPQIRALLDAGQDQTAVLPHQAGTRVLPSVAMTQVATSPAAKPRRSRGVLIGAIAGAALLIAGGAFSSYKFYEHGYDKGLADSGRASDAVSVYTVGPNSDFPNLNFGADTCFSGPPLVPGPQQDQGMGCDKPHDLELYYKTDLVNSSFSQYSADGSAPVPYPDKDQLAALAREVCWTDRLIGPYATKGSYQYAALVPDPAAWTSHDSPDHTVYCVMWADSGQLPADTHS